MQDLVVEDGRVVGVRVEHDGNAMNIEARRGVLLAAGGFGHNPDMRRTLNTRLVHVNERRSLNGRDAVPPRRDHRPRTAGGTVANYGQSSLALRRYCAARTAQAYRPYPDSMAAQLAGSLRTFPL